MANRHDYLAGLKEGSLLWGTHDHVSDESFFKGHFFTLNAKEYMELGQTMLKLAANFEISDKGRETAEIELTLNEVISILLLVDKYFQPNVLYARKPQFLFELEQKSKNLGKQLNAAVNYAKLYPLTAKIQDHLEKFRQTFLENEVSSGDLVKIEGLLGRNDQIQAIELMCYDIAN